jgi:large subunit ribosomal protein L25
VEVRCLPSDVPAHLEVDVSELKIGDTIHVSDLQFEKGEFLTDHREAVASVLAPTVHVAAPAEVAVEEAEEGEEGAEPAEGAAAEEAPSEEEGEGGKT